MKRDAIASYLDRGHAKFETISEQYGVSIEDIKKLDWDEYRKKWYNMNGLFEGFLIWGEIRNYLREFPGYIDYYQPK